MDDLSSEGDDRIAQALSSADIEAFASTPASSSKCWDRTAIACSLTQRNIFVSCSPPTRGHKSYIAGLQKRERVIKQWILASTCPVPCSRLWVMVATRHDHQPDLRRRVSVTGEERLNPFPAILLGISRVAAKEFESLSIRTIDLHKMKWTGWPPNWKTRARNPSWRCVGDIDGFRTFRRSRCHQSQVRACASKASTGSRAGPAALAFPLLECCATIPRPAAAYAADAAAAERAVAGDDSNAARFPLCRNSESSHRVGSRGAQVLTLCADVLDAASMRAAAAAARQQFGAIHGAIHAAGIAGGGMLSLKTKQQAQQ